MSKSGQSIHLLLILSFFGLNRYAVQLLTPSNVLSQINGHESILLDDVKEVDDLFFDAKKSAKHLVDQDSQFIV